METIDKPTTQEYMVKLIPHSAIPNKERIQDTIVSLPAELTRFGLSGVINHMLAQEPPIPYDFFSQGQFLRTSLAKFFITNNQSPEKTVVFEYMHSIKDPQEKATIPNPNWVASVDGSNKKCILAAGYDGCARIYGSNLKPTPLASTSTINSALKAVCWIAEDEFVSGGKDNIVRIWKYEQGNNKIELIKESKDEHTNSVEAVSACNNSNKFSTTGWDGSIKIWSSVSDAATKESKKRKTQTSVSALLTPITTLIDNGPGGLSTSCITSLSWPDILALYSGGHDHCIKQWDIETSAVTRSFNSKKLVTCVDFSLLNNLILSGHDDNTVRVWDCRSHNDMVANSFTSHSKWVSSAKWSKSNPNMLISGSFDGTIKIYDIRSTVAMHTINGHQGKVLDVDFHQQEDSTLIVSGGDDKQIKVYTL